jgi:hypothetical protein
MANDFQARMRQKAQTRQSAIAVVEAVEPAVQPETPKRKPAPSLAAVPPARVQPRPDQIVGVEQIPPVSKSVPFGNFQEPPLPRPLNDQELTALAGGQRPKFIVSEYEHKMLQSLGWKEGDPVPPGLSQKLQEIFASRITEPEFKGLLQPVVPIDFEDLTPEQQAEVQKWFKDTVEMVKKQQAQTPLQNFPPGVAEALRAADAVIDSGALVPVDFSQQADNNPIADRAAIEKVFAQIPEGKVVPLAPTVRQGVVQDETPREQLSAVIESDPICKTCGCNPFLEKAQLHCPHCGNDPFADLSQITIELEDKRAFLTAIGSCRPFEKSFTVFGDTVSVQFRSLSSMEYEALSNWAIDMQNKRILPVEAGARYFELMGSLVTQIVQLKSEIDKGSLFWQAPETANGYVAMSDWQNSFNDPNLTLWDLVGEFRKAVPSEAVIVALQRQLQAFNQLDFNLSREALNVSDFWKEI